MAEFADRDDPSELYTAIEKAYCEDRWPEVIERGGRLLGELAEEDRALRQRLQLLVAHAYLYGYGDRDSAEDLYRAVLESQAEVALRQIAAHGLEQCDLPPQRLAAAGAARSASAMAPEAESAAAGPTSTEPEDQSPPRIHPNPVALPQPAAAPALEDNSVSSLQESLQALIPDLPAQKAAAIESAPAMPWLESLGEVRASLAAPIDLPWAPPAADAAQPPEPPVAGLPEAAGAGPAEPARESLIAEVIDEPEMIEVHQADPTLAEEFELRESQRQDAFSEALPRPTREETAPPIEEDPDLLRGLLRVELF
ncbi:MAG: hypothetical protein ACK55D_11330 [Synechococcaceae cyanobacterium]